MLDQEEINFFIEEILSLKRNQLEITPEELQALIFPSDRFVILKLYGKGKNGMVFKIQSREDANIYALKISRDLDDYKYQEIFAKYNMAPFIHKVKQVRTKFKGVDITFVKAMMDPITTLYAYLKEGNSISKMVNALECLIKKKYILNYPEPYLHGDMHVENVVILKDKKTLGFIDFDWTIRKGPIFQILDCIPLITSIRLSRLSNSGQICESIIEMYNKLFNIKLKLNNFVRHPANGYGYRIGPILLHSYDWKPSEEQNPFPLEMDIRSAFPRLVLPKVVE